MSNLAASIVISAIDRLTAPTRRIARSIDRLDRVNKRLDTGIGQANRRLNERRRHLDLVAKSTERLSRAQERMQRTALVAGGAAVFGFGMQRVGRGILNPLGGALNQAGMFEDYTSSFEVLLKDVDLARQRMRDLAAFGATTPFELPGIVRASITLETLTNGALSTGDGLRMVGDVAAGVNQPIEELSMWFGRLYDGLQSGRPVGEALMRLQELGIMSGDVRSQIEELQKSGSAGNEVWAVASKSFERFAGMMDERSRNLSGRLSNLSDVWTNLRAALGRPLSAVVKPIISGFTAVLGVVTGLFESFPLLAGAIGVTAGAIGVFAVGAGALITAAAILVGSLAALSFGMEWLAVKTTIANSRMLAFHGTNLLTSKGLLLTSRLLLGKVTLAFRGLIPLVGGLAAVIMGISAPVWGIVAVIAAAAAAIWYFWGPVKSFFTGFVSGLSEVMTGFRPVIDAGKAVLQFFGSIFSSRVTESSQSLEDLGRVFGKIIARVLKMLLLPLRFFGLLKTGINLVKSALQSLLSPLKTFAHLWEKLKSFFGFGDRPDAPVERASRPARRVRRIAAASAIAATPAFASPGAVQASAPDPIVRAVQSGDVTHFSAPITVNVPPGADTHAISREVERAVKAALLESQRRQAAEKRRRLYG